MDSQPPTGRFRLLTDVHFELGEYFREAISAECHGVFTSSPSLRYSVSGLIASRSDAPSASPSLPPIASGPLSAFSDLSSLTPDPLASSSKSLDHSLAKTTTVRSPQDLQLRSCMHRIRTQFRCPQPSFGRPIPALAVFGFHFARSSWRRSALHEYMSITLRIAQHNPQTCSSLTLNASYCSLVRSNRSRAPLPLDTRFRRC